MCLTLFAKISEFTVYKRILHKCSCFIEFIKPVGEKEIKCKDGLAFYHFFCNEFNRFNNAKVRENKETSDKDE